MLSDFHETFSNQSVEYLASLKKAQEVHTSSIESIKPKGSDIPAKASAERFKRFAQEYQTLDERRRGFQHAYINSNDPQYGKRYSPQFILDRDRRIQDGASILATENIGSKENSVDADINAASLHYANHYQHPPDFKYNADHLHPLDNANHHGHFGFPPNYQLHQAPGVDPAQPAEGGEANPGGNEDVQLARLTHRPYNLNYNGPYNAPQHPELYRHPGAYYPDGGHVEGNGRHVAPATEQSAGNPSRITDDQNEGQSALAGYDYNPRFPYRPPYHDGFYGPPDFYNGPFNGSFNPGYQGQPADNYTNGQFPNGQFPHGQFPNGQFPHGQFPHGHFPNGQFPNGPHPFNGYGFYPNGPYQPYYPNYYGNGKTAQPQNPPENSGTAEQTSPENGQGNGEGNSQGNGQGNGTFPPGYPNRPPYGFPPYGPFYGDFHLPYPPFPFNGLPYRFGPVFPDHLIPRYKPVPYSHVPPNPYQPDQGKKSVSDAPVTTESPMNSDAEVIPEGSSDIVQALISNRRGNLLFPWPISKETKVKRQQALKQ